MRLRQLLAALFFAWIVGWPLVHVALAASRDLNPWKLGGWGMYSEVQPYQLGLKAFVLAEDGEFPRELGPVLGPAQVVLVDGSGTSELVLDELPHDQLVELAGHSQGIRVLGSRRSIEGFSRQLATLAAPRLSSPPASVLLLITKPQIDPARRLAFVETTAYHFRPGEGVLRRVGVLRSDRTPEATLVERLRETAAGAAAATAELPAPRPSELGELPKET